MKSAVSVTFFLTLSVALFLLWYVPVHVEEIIGFARAHPVLAPLLLVAWRFLAMVFPPLPGGMVAFALLPVFGWFSTFLYSFVGVFSGAMVAFLLARRFQEPLAAKFVPLQKLHEWEGQISPERKFWGFVVLRFATSPAADFVSYAAGLTKVSFKTFALSTAFVEIPTALYFYLGEEVYLLVSQYSVRAGVILLLGIALIFSFFSARILAKFRKDRDGR